MRRRVAVVRIAARFGPAAATLPPGYLSPPPATDADGSSRCVTKSVVTTATKSPPTTAVRCRSHARRARAIHANAASATDAPQDRQSSRGAKTLKANAPRASPRPARRREFDSSVAKLWQLPQRCKIVDRSDCSLGEEALHRGARRGHDARARRLQS